MKKWIYLMCAGAFLIIVVVMIVFYVKINNGDAIKKAPAVVWSQVDSNHPNQIMASFEKRSDYLDVQRLAEDAVHCWYQDNPGKEVTAVSITVILTVSDK